jgi:pimeloyl-ACP methyl ester carboxylesterase
VTHVAVLIPGLMGSKLYLGDDLIWPGAPSELFLPYNKMKELLRADLVARDLIRSYTIFSPQYETLIDDLSACDFSEASSPPTLYPYPYDWRRSVEHAADGLADLLDRALDQHTGAADISLVAHSLGGLIARHYLESGRFVARPGYRAARRLITLGTPHRGSPLALTAAMGMEKRLFLSRDQVLALASDPRYPSLYQLLPPRGEPFAWDFDAGGEYTQVEIFDNAIATALGLVGANLLAAQQLHASLDLSRRPPHVRYFFFVGTRQATASASAVRRRGPRYVVTNLEPEDAGDGTVPIWSAGLTGVQSRPVGGEHGTIYQNDDLRRTLAVLLGKAGVLAAVPVAIEVAVRDPVVEPGQIVHVALTFAAGTSQLDGELRVERALLGPNETITSYVAIGTPYPIRYSGLAAEKLAVMLDAPSVRGFYRVAYYQQGAAEPAGSDELIVQEPPPAMP